MNAQKACVAWMLFLVLSACSVNGDFDSQVQFDRFVDKFHLVGSEAIDAQARMADAGFRCFRDESGPNAQIFCDRTQKRWYWMGYEGQTVTMIYDRKSRVVTQVYANWGHFLS